MKQPYQFPAISHFCDVLKQDFSFVNTQEVLNGISIHSATKMEYLLMLLHKEAPDLFNAIATGEGYFPGELEDYHPDMKQVMGFCDAILSEDYHEFA